MFPEVNPPKPVRNNLRRTTRPVYYIFEAVSLFQPIACQPHERFRDISLFFFSQRHLRMPSRCFGPCRSHRCASSGRSSRSRRSFASTHLPSFFTHTHQHVPPRHIHIPTRSGRRDTKYRWLPQPEDRRSHPRISDLTLRSKTWQVSLPATPAQTWVCRTKSPPYSVAQVSSFTNGTWTCFSFLLMSPPSEKKR